MALGNPDMNLHDSVPPAPPLEPYRPTRWSTVIALSFALLIAGVLGLIMAPIQEAARLELQFTDVQMSLINGTSKALPMALLSVPIGLAIDHANRARLALIFGLIWTAGTFWTAYANDFTSLFTARMLVGFGTGSLLGVALSMIADLCMPEKRGRVLLLAGIGSWFGVAVAFGLGGGLLGYFSRPGTGLIEGLSPWRQTIIAVGILGAVSLIPIALMREPVRHEREQRDNRIMPALRALWARRAFMIPLLFAAMTGGIAEGAAALWSAPVLSRDYGLQPHQFGGWMDAVIFVSGVGGSIIGGFVSDWGSRQQRRGGILIGGIIATALSIPAGAFTVMPSVGMFAFALAVLLTGGAVIAIVLSAAITSLIPNEERGTALAASGVVSTLTGLALAPSVVTLGGWIYGDEGHLGVIIAWVGVVTGVMSLIGLILAMANAPQRVADTISV